MQVIETITDETLLELQTHGTSAFPFAYYDEQLLPFQSGLIEWHWHPEFEWVLVEQGLVDCRVGLETIRLQPGDGIFFNHKTIHRMESNDGAYIPNVLFLPDLIAPPASAIFQKYVLPILDSNRAYFVFRASDPKDKPLLNSLQTIMAIAQEGSELDIQIALLNGWRCFFERVEPDLLADIDPKDVLLQARTFKMVQFIADHYAQNITLSDIAKAGNISKSEALRCFHRMFQSTPIQFLIQYRLNRAKERLLASECTITQAAIESGIENVSYFIKIFTRQFGLTPKKFVQLYRK